MRHRESEDSKEVVLIDRIILAEFSFFGAADQDTQPRWRDLWQDASKLPLLVRLHVTFPPNDRRKWPELVIAAAIRPYRRGLNVTGRRHLTKRRRTLRLR